MATGDRRPGLVALGVAVAGLGVLEALVLTGAVNPYINDIVCYAGIVAISALGLNLVYGYTGQFSLGHAAFYGVGAYAAALVTKYVGNGEGWLLAPGIVVGALLGGVLALLIGLPILRLKSDYLGIATLGFGIVMNALFKNSDKLLPVLGGSTGMRAVPKLTSLPWVFGLAVLAVVVLRNLVYSSVGRALLSVREDQLASEAVG
ncbi:branched-chain amino acid ABC transporter permease, partial [candidate division WOR-3 bacterium]|nr:branched-chain amino acid ABC transporter permease [candidate division WOR-3 bacterium]